MSKIRIPVQKILDWFKKMYDEHWSYVWGKAQAGCVDCSGAFSYVFSKLGGYMPQGSNTMARKHVVKLLPISQAKPGMAAFKLYQPGEEGWDLPDKFKNDPDQNDYYHVGLVDEDCKNVLNAKGEKYGFSRDALTKKNGWDAVGYLIGVEYPSEVTIKMDMAVVVGDGSLNLRQGTSTSHRSLLQIPRGKTVVVLEKTTDTWWKVQYNNQVGYVMAKFLSEDGLLSITLTRETATALKEALQKALGGE